MRVGAIGLQAQRLLVMLPGFVGAADFAQGYTDIVVRHPGARVLLQRIAIKGDRVRVEGALLPRQHAHHHHDHAERSARRPGKPEADRRPTGPGEYHDPDERQMLIVVGNQRVFHERDVIESHYR